LEEEKGGKEKLGSPADGIYCYKEKKNVLCSYNKDYERLFQDKKITVFN